MFRICFWRESRSGDTKHTHKHISINKIECMNAIVCIVWRSRSSHFCWHYDRLEIKSIQRQVNIIRMAIKWLKLWQYPSGRARWPMPINIIASSIVCCGCIVGPAKRMPFFDAYYYYNDNGAYTAAILFFFVFSSAVWSGHFLGNSLQKLCCRISLENTARTIHSIVRSVHLVVDEHAACG